MSEFTAESRTPGDEQATPPRGQAAGAEQAAEASPEESAVGVLEALVAERTGDLQRLQAEYANYKKRVDRDRSVAREKGVESVVREMLPVLDAINVAEQAGELHGGFEAVVNELKRVTSKFGLESFGAVGEEFDPHKHDALMQMPVPGAVPLTIAQVIQLGFALDEQVIRPARVAVVAPGSENLPVEGDADEPTDVNSEQSNQ